MNDSTKLQVNIIMNKFNALKDDYIQLKSENNDLIKEIKKLSKLLKDKNERSSKLINLFKNILTQNQGKLDSLQRENSHCQNTIQEQNELIDRHLNTIEKLKEEINLLKNMKENCHINKEREVSSEFIKNEMNKKSNIPNYIRSNLNKNFMHPSFHTETSATTNIRKKLHPIFRWPNLDVTVRRDNTANNVTNISFPVKKDKSLPNAEKRRKLYCPDDSTVDLENEEDGN